MTSLRTLPSLSAEKTQVDGCILTRIPVYEDMRGVFAEAANEAQFRELGLPTEWPQDNISSSHKNVLRGLHIQKNNPQGKLVRCVQGKILDVCLDLRKESPTYLKHTALILDHPSMALYCPPGTAHGFFAIEESMIYYKCTSLYDKTSDGGVWAHDPDLKIDWPSAQTIMSDKDMSLPKIEEFLKRW